MIIMYMVKYVYAPYPNVYFRTKKDAIEYCNTQVAQTEVYKEILLGWKRVEKDS